MQKLIYNFSITNSEGGLAMESILGQKGVNLFQMCRLSLPIPPGFTISSELCNKYSKLDSDLKSQFKKQLLASMRQLEKETSKKFGSDKNPLLVSVRSGAKVSMPGMMDSILNLGMNDKIVEAMAKETNNQRFAYDSYRRFLEMYGSIVLKIPHCLFKNRFEHYKIQNKFLEDKKITTEILKQIVVSYKSIIKKHTDSEFDSDPYIQLERAIESVFASWMSERAIAYRAINNISNDIGTAVNVQAMVFGNKDKNSGTGLIFSRCPTTGNKQIFGEFLHSAQGEDIVSGIRTPSPIAASATSNGNSFQELMPKLYTDLIDVCNKLEKSFKDMQDIEFTIEDGKLYILQTRNGKRSALSAVKIAVDMFKEGTLSKQDALMKIDAESLNKLLHASIDYSTNPNVIANGLPASPGAVTGVAIFSSEEAENTSINSKVILIRNNTSTEDIEGMHLSAGMITSRGGVTSHAAVLARAVGTPCVCGVNGLIINEEDHSATINNKYIIKQGDTITIDGNTGNIIIDDVKFIDSKISEEFKTLLNWADEERSLKVRANAETVADVLMAIQFGAYGIGLCRTEHMFLDENKISLVRQMIIVSDKEQRKKIIERLKAIQYEDFISLLRITRDKPINIRLLDPPLHEFLPTQDKEKNLLAQELNLPISCINHKLNNLRESNPMLGHRGCRLGISHPDIYIMQIQAILESIYFLEVEENVKTNVELMIPFIMDVNELKQIKKHIDSTIDFMENQYNIKFDIKIGAMIELPRAALMAGEIAKYVDYFSFGSNDLTQTTFGISRDDIGSFIPAYFEHKIFKYEPFVTIDECGVGELIEIAKNRGKKTNSKLVLGVCGEHAGDPKSIEFFYKSELDYISCSPYRIPIAKIASAQSKIKLNSKHG